MLLIPHIHGIIIHVLLLERTSANPVSHDQVIIIKLCKLTINAVATCDVYIKLLSITIILWTLLFLCPRVSGLSMLIYIY